MPRMKEDDIQRVELRLRCDDPMVVELLAEMTTRGVTLQQHIFDLLRARYLARHGESLHAVLWYPTPPDSAASSAEAEVADTIASEAAAIWADMQ